jgi:hypothetical protein
MKYFGKDLTIFLDTYIFIFYKIKSMLKNILTYYTTKMLISIHL